MKNTMTKPKISSCVGLPALAKTIAITPAPMKAQTAVILRPYLSSAYIMNRLAQGTAMFMPRMNVRDLVMVKPRSCIMLGNQLPKPMATPKNAEKQIMPAITRFGNILKTRAKGSDLVLLAASVVRASFGPAMSMRASTTRASLPLPWVARKRGDADDDPDAPPSNNLSEIEREQRGDRPHAGAADEVHEG